MTDSAGAQARSLAAAGADYIRFIVLADARTGSYMLVQALDSHPNVTCFSELFNWQLDYVDFNVAGYDNSSAEDKALRDRDFERFLRERIYCPRPVEIRATGFKLLYSHVWGYTGLLERLVEDSEVRIVHLRRRNLLRMFVSSKLAEASGVWRVDRGFTPVQLLQQRTWRRALRRPSRALAALRSVLRPPAASPAAEKALTLSIDECLAFFAKAQHEVEHFTHLFEAHPSLSICYEDTVSDRAGVFGQVQSFLGAPPARLMVTLARQNPEPLSELIANYEELRAAFRGTPQAAFFDR